MKFCVHRQSTFVVRLLHRLMMALRTGLLNIGILALAACSVPQPVDLLNALVPASGYTLQTYQVDEDIERLKVDIYTPDDPAERLYTIVFIYGGAWRDGARGEYEFVGQALAEAGHTVIIPDYRLYPTVVYPEFIVDVADAIKAVQANDEQWLGYTLDGIVLMGHSSGAHTAAMLASDPGWLSSGGVVPKALVAISGPYDLPLDDPEVGPVFQGVATPDEAQPVALVTRTHPPTLLIHGEEDERVLPFHTENYSAALQGASVRVDVHWLPETGHVGAISGLAAPLDRGDRNRDRITRFLDSLPVRSMQ